MNTVSWPELSNAWSGLQGGKAATQLGSQVLLQTVLAGPSAKSVQEQVNQEHGITVATAEDDMLRAVEFAPAIRSKVSVFHIYQEF